MKKAFPMLCAHSPSVHSYHFYIWHVSYGHWALLLSARIDFKILLFVFKVFNGLGPLYLSELLEPYIPNGNLRSSTKKLLVVPKYNLKTYGYRAFSRRAPTLWNALPDDIIL